MTSSPAVGIHAHPQYKLGLKAPKNAPALEARRFIRQAPDHPVAADHLGKIKFGLDTNDKFGVCGPTSVDNLVRLITTALLGQTVTVPLDGVYDLYRRSGNPGFDPKTGADDNGVDMQTMLEAAHDGGVKTDQGVIKPVAFAKIQPDDDEMIEAAVAIFGGLLWGVLLQVAQQAQTDATPPEWKYDESDTWGGHAVMNGAYEAQKLIDLISWAMRVISDSTFRKHQLQEVWLVVFEWHLQHPAFQQGVDLAALKSDYADLTGKTLNA